MHISLKQADTGAAKRKKKRKLIAFFTLIILTGLLIYILVEVTYPSTNTKIAGDLFPGAGSAVAGHLPKMTDDEIKAQMQREADKSRFSFKMNSRPTFKNGTGKGTLHIENPNHNLYPFVVEIFLTETGEKVYDSGGILPNHHISEAKLTKALSKGEHAATAYITVYDPQTNRYSGKSAVSLTLIIHQ